MKERFKIWMLPKWYPNREDPQFGVFIQKHAQAISLRNDITVLYVHSSNATNKKFEIVENNSRGLNEVVVYFRKSNSSFGKVVNFFRYLSAMRKGINILNTKHSSPDIIHAYILTRTGVVAWYLSARKKIPFVISEQWSGYVTGRFQKSSSIKKSITKAIVRKAKAVSTVSDFLLMKMKECGFVNSNFSVIPNIIKTIAPANKKNETGIVNVLMVADLVDEIKNISGVIKMIANLKTDLSFRLEIVGRGPDGEILKKLASDKNLLDKKIFFAGLKSNEEVYEYLMRCDFLVMNSRHETFSLICAEAMSCGKPVLATRCGGPEEFVNKDSGILIRPDDESELEKNFTYMLRNFHSFDSSRIINYVQSRFSNDKVGEAFQQYYLSAKKSND